MLKGSAGRPDILVQEPNVSPVVVETEILPAATVEAEAASRLGSFLRSNGRPILSTIAVRLPNEFKSKSGAALRKLVVGTVDLQMSMFTGNSPTSYQRWPTSGWLRGGVADLSLLVQSATLPPAVIENAADTLVAGVSEAAGLLEEMARSSPGASKKISEQLKQDDGHQTLRMAATILANAFVFHGSLAGGPGELAKIKSVEEIKGGPHGLTKTQLLDEWRKLLQINYWPIFDIARRILELVPAAHGQALVDRLAGTAEQLLQSRLMRSHDLTGAVFQRLIADRKFLAAFYTTPASASLLVGLAIRQDRPLDAKSWGDRESVQRLRVGDFACGTGTLLSTAYQRIGQLHELAGGNAELIHAEMMARALVGCDVLPAAAHLTASMLAGAHPTAKYLQSSVLTMPYGRVRGKVALGSIDLLESQGTLPLLGLSARSAGATGEGEEDVWIFVPHKTFDVVLMNPPFTRATGHHEIGDVGVRNPMFAAFSATDAEQKKMSELTKRLTKSSSAHGNAGEASIFLVLADRKLKKDGVLGLVMPLMLMAGDAWEESRIMLRKGYRDLVLVSISGGADATLSFSADTNMGECLVLGRKGVSASKRAAFVVLKQRPTSSILGSSCASQLTELLAAGKIRQLEDGPTGGTPLHFGDDEIGQVLEAPLPESGGWNLARIADLSLAQTAYQLAEKNTVWLPASRRAEAKVVAMKVVSAIGSIGPGDRDINGDGSNGEVRGPFEIVDISPDAAPTYPVLWAHDATRERSMRFGPDSEGRIRKAAISKDQAGIDSKVDTVFATASHCHFNRDFRFNSQSTAMQYTPERAIGGRAWPSIKLSSAAMEKALVLWGNTSLGVLLYWWYASKAQPGRGSILRSKLASFPVLDVKSLSKDQLRSAVAIFADLGDAELLPADQIDKDDSRKKLDERFGLEVLGLPKSLFATGNSFELLRRKLAAEPSIRG